MSACLHQPSILNDGDAVDINEEIELLQTQIQQALTLIKQTQVKVAELTADLRRAKSQIAPIRKVPFDILSLIFQICGQADWAAPLRIGAVCRWWREVVHLTPRAWCYIDLWSVDDEICQTYFERSGHFNLHVRIWEEDDIKFLATVAHRIDRMTIQVLPDDMQNAIFPSLHTLLLPAGPPYKDDVFVITTAYFPNLLHLEIHHELIQTAPCPKLPQLQTLIITVHGDGWYEVAQACRTSLISLKIIYARHYNADIMYHLHLPRLQHLMVIDADIMNESWLLRIDVPELKTYIAECAYGANVPILIEGLEHVTHMRLTRIPSMPVPNQLRVIQLDVKFEDFRRFFHHLETHTIYYSHLKILEFGQTWMDDSEILNARMVLDMWEGYSIPSLEVLPHMGKKWTIDLPGEYELMVRGYLYLSYYLVMTRYREWKIRAVCPSTEHIQGIHDRSIPY